MIGRVVDFDDDRGLGTVVTDHGQRFVVQCIAVADGSRHIDAGATVRFETVAKLGRWEAGDVENLANGER